MLNKKSERERWSGGRNREREKEYERSKEKGTDREGEIVCEERILREQELK